MHFSCRTSSTKKCWCFDFMSFEHWNRKLTVKMVCLCNDIRWHNWEPCFASMYSIYLTTTIILIRMIHRLYDLILRGELSYYSREELYGWKDLFLKLFTHDVSSTRWLTDMLNSAPNNLWMNILSKVFVYFMDYFIILAQLLFLFNWCNWIELYLSIFRFTMIFFYNSDRIFADI